ncbi:putative hydrocarbon binding protein [Paenibacillus sp. DS2015]|uniref:V4R domain-containing protein n=1 Tax=Paenibacillus sp. DS2015 TaxID=3373917 RepID=UPI003D235DB8
MSDFTFEDMKSIARKRLGAEVPLELFRAIRLIGLNQSLPAGGKGTTMTIGRQIGKSLPVTSVEELLQLIEDLKIGIPHIISSDERGMHIAVEDCFCEGLPVQEGKMVCDLEGAIMEGALTKIFNKRVTAREVKCNVSGDERCEYELRF